VGSLVPDNDCCAFNPGSTLAVADASLLDASWRHGLVLFPVTGIPDQACRRDGVEGVMVARQSVTFMVRRINREPLSRIAVVNVSPARTWGLFSEPGCFKAHEISYFNVFS
jgi:hypothetical protein